MTHIPTLLDIVSDLRRCTMLDFDDTNFVVFWDKAQENLKNLSSELDSKTRENMQNELSKSQDKNLEPFKRKENLLMAANLLQGYALKLA